MTRIVTIYGLISSFIIVLMLSVSGYLMTHDKGHFSNNGMLLGYLLGYASMLLAFVFIYIAIKNYRDKYLNGAISFGKAFGTGFLIALIGSAFYTATWIVIYKNFCPNYMDDYINGVIAHMQKSGKSAADILKEKQKLDHLNAVYQTWPGMILMTIVEILPVGILVTLISAAILRRKNNRQAIPPQG
jgi:glucan phosphoethanolaminetransferase (alkaline phosphatase superfamily)